MLPTHLVLAPGASGTRIERLGYGSLVTFDDMSSISSQSVVSNCSIHPKCSVYYFEATIMNETEGAAPSMILGICRDTRAQANVPGSKPDTVGLAVAQRMVFVSGDSIALGGSQLMDPQGSTVGCILNFVTREVCFTINGELSETAAVRLSRDVSLNGYYISIALTRTMKCAVRVALLQHRRATAPGVSPFLFSLQEYEATTMEHIMKTMVPSAEVCGPDGSTNVGEGAAVGCSCVELLRLVARHLASRGMTEALRTLQQEQQEFVNAEDSTSEEEKLNGDLERLRPLSEVMQSLYHFMVVDGSPQEAARYIQAHSTVLGGDTATNGTIADTKEALPPSQDNNTHSSSHLTEDAPFLKQHPDLLFMLLVLRAVEATSLAMVTRLVDTLIDGLKTGMDEGKMDEEASRRAPCRHVRERIARFVVLFYTSRVEAVERGCVPLWRPQLLRLRQWCWLRLVHQVEQQLYGRGTRTGAAEVEGGARASLGATRTLRGLWRHAHTLAFLHPALSTFLRLVHATILRRKAEPPAPLGRAEGDGPVGRDVVEEVDATPQAAHNPSLRALFYIRRLRLELREAIIPRT